MDENELFVDYMSWERLTSQCDAIQNLSPVEREKAKRGFRTLGELLGEQFLSQCIRERHPFLTELFNLAPWTRRHFTWLADSLMSLRDSANFDGLVKRLRDKAQYAEAMSVLRAAAAMRAAGFDVGFDPTVPNFQKVPDLELNHRDTRDRIYVEVSVLTTSEVAKAAERTSWGILSEVLYAVPFLHFSGRIYRRLSERHLADVIARVRAIAARGKAEFCELAIHGVLEMAVAPDADRSLLDEWANARGLKVGSCEGPPFGVDEVQRVCSRLRNEQRQVPSDTPNILVIEGFNAIFDRRSIETIIGEMAESIYDQPHVFAAIIAGRYMGSGKPEATMYGQHCHIRRLRYDALVDEYLVLVNRFCGTPVSPAALSDLYRAYWQA